MILDKNNKTLLEKYNNFIKNSPFGHFQQDIRWADLKTGWERYIKNTGEILSCGCFFALFCVRLYCR